MTQDSENNSEAMIGLHQSHKIQTETVTFEEDGAIVIEDFPVVSPMTDYLLGSNDQLINDIKGYLSRPITVGNIVWNETDALGTDLFEPNTGAPANSGYDLPDTWLDVPMINEKIKGFSFLRCSFKVKLNFNANPFNAGRVIMYFYPFANNMSHQTNPVITSTVHFGGVTGYRHVDIDLSTATSAELTIPYIGLISHHNLIRSRSSMGRVRCIVYSRLTSGAAETQTSIDGTVWVQAHDIDIQMPTGVDQLATRRAMAQAKPALGKEKQQPAKGTIETIANTTSSICEKVGRIPGCAEVANGARWLADCVAGVASIFGWSRPTDPSFATIVQPSYVRHMNTFNGDTKSKPLALDARNEIETPLASFTTTDDEMALAALISRPTFLDRFSMSQSQGANTTLWRWPVTPTACVKSATADPYPVGVMYHHTFLSYLSRLFRFWRGTINYHFKIVKTGFHSGRIRVFFVPLAQYDTDVSHIDFNKCYNSIYDIREGASFDFAIPYVSNTVWRDINHSETSSLDPSPDIPCGMIYVEVLNALRNPSVASDTIEFIVETSGGEDFQFAFLTQSTWVLPLRIAHENFLSLTSSDVLRQTRRRVRAQCDDFFETNKMKDYNPNVLGIGEAITSLRQLLKRYGRFPKPLPAAPDDKLNVLRPYDTNDCFPRTVSNNQSGPLDGLFDYVSYLYRMQCGSMRMMFIPRGSSTPSYPNIYMRTSVTGDPFPPTATTYFKVVDASSWPAVYTSVPNVRFLENLEGTLEVDVPFYQQYPIQMSNLGGPEPADPFSEGVEQPYNYGTEIALDNKNEYDVYRSIGEDFSFGYIVGPPLGIYVPSAP